MHFLQDFMRKLENGFYTALGTPIDEQGDLVESSLRQQTGN